MRSIIYHPCSGCEFWRKDEGRFGHCGNPESEFFMLRVLDTRHVPCKVFKAKSNSPNGNH